ncbi:MAG: MFS transporter [Bacilli bacterium]
MENNVKKINFAFFILYFADALISPFLALFFLSIGISGTKQGVLLALIPLSNLLGNLLYGKLSFNLKRNLRLASILCFIQLIVMSFYGFLNNFAFLIVFTIIFALHNSPSFSITDGIGCTYNDIEHKKYAITRMFGSIGYLVSVFVGGILIDFIDYKYVFLIASLLFGIASILFFFMEPYEENSVCEKSKISYKEVLSNKMFLIYLFSYILVLGAWNIGEAYISTYLKANGLGVKEWGYCYAGQIVFEVLIILVGQKIINENNKNKFLYLSYILMIIRSFVLFTPLPLLIKILIELPLRGIAWGLFLSCHMDLVKRLLKVDLVTKGVTALVIVVNIFNTICEYIVPYLFKNLSYLYLVAGVFQCVGLVLVTRINFKKFQ